MQETLFEGLYCILGEDLSNGRDNVEVAQAMLTAGVKIIQYREKEKSMLEKYRQCLQIKALTHEHGARFIVNDDIALALAVKADGVHVGQDDLPVERVREIVGAEMLIGLSTHNPEQAHKAVAAGVDYIGVGPIYATKTKKDVCAPVGLSYLEYVAQNINLPFVAIGGIKKANLHDVIDNGAKCFAMVSEVLQAPDIELQIEQIKALAKQ